MQSLRKMYASSNFSSFSLKYFMEVSSCCQLRPTQQSFFLHLCTHSTSLSEIYFSSEISKIFIASFRGSLRLQSTSVITIPAAAVKPLTTFDIIYLKQLFTILNLHRSYFKTGKKKYFRNLQIQKETFQQQIYMYLQGQHPTDEQIAAILLASGVDSSGNEPHEQFIQNCQLQLKENKNALSKSEVDHLRKNIVSIRAKIKEKVMTRNVLCGIGHVSKWGYTLYQCISKAKGWTSLVSKTAAYGPTQLAKYSFGRAVASKSMWWITAAIATVQVGLQFKKWYTGQISAKQFWVNSVKTIAISAVTVVGGAGGAYTGAALGMACGGPVGAIIGAIVGGISGSMVTSYGSQKLLEYADTKYQQYSANRLIRDALNFFELPGKCSLGTLETLRKTKFMQYHPDKWVDEKKEKQQEMAKKLQQTMEYYEILKNALQARLEVKKKEALEFYQFPPVYSPADLEAIYKMKQNFYDPQRWVTESQKKKQEMANRLKKTKQCYEILRNDAKTDLKIGD